MKNMKKRILSILFAFSIIVSSIGIYLTDSFPMSRVNAASNPEYVAEIATGDESNYVRKNVPYSSTTTVGKTYVLTCNYYTTSSADGHLVACFDSGVKWGVASTNTSNTYGKVGTLTLQHTATTDDGWIALRFLNYNTTESFYIWNIKLTIGGETNSNFNNADFTEGDGSWIRWQMPMYYKYTTPDDTSDDLNNLTASNVQAASEYTGHTIHAYDPTVLTFLPDYTLLPDYEWDGEAKSLTFSAAMEFDLSTVTDYHLHKDGYAFIGWKDQNGNWLTNDMMNGYEFAADTVLTAQYIEYDPNTDGDFAIRSEEMRTDGTLGIRFIVEMSDALMRELPNAGEYGTIVLPSVILDANGWSMTVLQTNDWHGETFSANGWADLTYYGTYTYGGKDYTPEIVKAKNIYETLDDRIYYTLCITNLTEAKDNYDRQYTVKGYIKYTDNNGIERILYTDYASTNPYLVSKTDLTKTDVSAEASAILNPIVSAVDTKYAEDRAKWTGTEITDTTVKTGTAGSNETIYSYTHEYKGTIRVRELSFDFGLTAEGEDPIEIIHMSDLHFNYMNALDFADADSTLLATYDVRKNGWSGSVQGGNVSNGRKLLEYARTADELIISGDVMDYLSKGAIELTYREIWDKYPYAVISLGNHEISQKVSNTVAETMSREDRFAWLAQVWKNDSNYSKKVVGEKLMLIQLDNSENAFNATQFELLTADLAEARTNGYKVLLFMHEPLTTGNESDTAVTPLLTGGDINSANGATYDFYNYKSNSNVHPDKDTDTANVYNLIRSYPDVIEGVFNGHIHTNFYTEIKSTDESNPIEQYTVGAGFNSDLIKILVK